MIIFLLTIALFISSVVTEILLFRYNDKHPHIFKNENEMTKEEIKQDKRNERAEKFAMINLVPLFILLFVILISGFFVVHDNLPAYRDTILKEKALIIYKIENNEYESNSEMISAIDDFNNDVIEARKYLENPWISWYRSRHYKTINPIEYTIDVNGVTYKN